MWYYKSAIQIKYAEHGTRDKVETWVHGNYYMWFFLTQAGIDTGLGNDPQYPRLLKAKVAEYWGDPNDPSSTEWVYRYNDKTTIEDMISACNKDYALRYADTGYLAGNYNANTIETYENRVVCTETYVIKEAYDETITTCTVCGAKK